MNLYFLLEGRSTEPKLYRAWLRTAFPQLREVFNPAAATDDNFLLISGHGQPAIFGMLDATIQDLCEYNGPVLDPSYMAALIRRVHDTDHLPSLGVLLDVWRSLGAQLPDRSP